MTAAGAPYDGPWVSWDDREYYVSVAKHPTMLDAVAEFISLNGINSIATEDYLEQYGTPAKATMPMCQANSYHNCESKCAFMKNTLVWRSDPPVQQDHP